MNNHSNLEKADTETMVYGRIRHGLWRNAQNIFNVVCLPVCRLTLALLSQTMLSVSAFSKLLLFFLYGQSILVSEI